VSDKADLHQLFVSNELAQWILQVKWTTKQ